MLEKQYTETNSLSYSYAGARDMIYDGLAYLESGRGRAEETIIT